MKDNSKRYLVFEKNIHEYVITDSYKDWESKVIILNAQKKVHIIHLT